MAKRTDVGIPRHTLLKMGVFADTFRSRSFHFNMAAAPKPLDLEHPRFFVEQSERLSALLNAVVAESSTATDPDACIDYLEITEILVELLDQSQYFSVIPRDQFQDNWKDVQSLMSKVQTIEDAVADWDSRVKKHPSMDSAETVVAAAGSRKRTRTVDSEIELLHAAKRCRESEYTLVEDADTGMEVVDESISPSIKRARAAWWTEPYYD